jgi:hypothetical protein
MRAFWGINDTSHRILNRKFRVDRNIKGLLRNKLNTDFITYVFGENNMQFLQKLGVKNCILIHKEPHKYDPINAQYMHKLEALRYAMEVDGYDEMVHLDWDCIPKKRVDDEFWRLLQQKQSFQANLIQYHIKKAKWRGNVDARKIPNGGFVYIRDKNIPSELIKVWETMKGPSAEPPMAKYTDNLMGGWQGKHKYWELFEPMVCHTHRDSVFSKEPDLVKTKNIYFIHYQGGL